MKGKLFSVFVAALLVAIGTLIYVKGYVGKAAPAATLGGSVQVVQVNGGASDKVNPGSQITLKTVVKNIGSLPSHAGEVYIRFGFPSQIKTKVKSVIFETEKVSLPSIEPGAQVEIAFKTPHVWPSVYDYIRNDWNLRRYQVVTVVDSKEYVIGALSIAFTATYYPGLVEELPATVPTT